MHRGDGCLNTGVKHYALPLLLLKHWKCSSFMAVVVFTAMGADKHGFNINLCHFSKRKGGGPDMSNLPRLELSFVMKSYLKEVEVVQLLLF